MTRFEQELKNNNFVCTYCQKCNQFVWPPSYLCNNCLNETVWKHVGRKAKLIEFIKKDNEYICVAEFVKGIRIMGSIQNVKNITNGQMLYLIKCYFDNHEKFIFEQINYD